MKKYIVVYQNQETGEAGTMTCIADSPCGVGRFFYRRHDERYLILSITPIPEIKAEVQKGTNCNKEKEEEKCIMTETEN